MTKRKSSWNNSRGYAVVEATILFPIMLMIFAGVVLLAIYLPVRSVLQNATQQAAVALATEESDTWLEYSEDAMSYGLKSNPKNVYVSVFSSFFKGDKAAKAEKIVSNLETNEGLVEKPGELEVECHIVNYVIYKEIVVTATRTITSPVDLSFVGFPKEIEVTVSSSAVVQNGDEFVRNIDLAADVASYFAKKYDLESKMSKVSEFINKFNDFLGI